MFRFLWNGAEETGQDMFRLVHSTSWYEAHGSGHSTRPETGGMHRKIGVRMHELQKSIKRKNVYRVYTKTVIHKCVHLHIQVPHHPDLQINAYLIDIPGLVFELQNNVCFKFIWRFQILSLFQITCKCTENFPRTKFFADLERPPLKWW